MKDKVYGGIYRGVVEDVSDPLRTGRCRVRVPSIHGNLQQSDIKLLPWARYISPLPTGKDKGMYIIPEVKDIVWVMFEGGNKNFPVYLGSTYGVVDGYSEAPLTSDDSIETTEVLYKSKDTNGIKACIKKTSDYFTIEFGNSYIKINSSGDIEINTDGNLNITSKSNVTMYTEGKILLNE